MAGLEKAYAWDIKTRINDQSLNPANLKPQATDMKEGVVYEKGADLIIHSVVSIAAKLLKKSKIMRSILSHHSEPEDTAWVFNAVKPKLAVYSHIVLYGRQKPADVMKRACKSYAGPLMVRKDLLKIDIGKEAVTIAK